MDFEEQIIAKSENLLIDELQLLGIHAGGMFNKIPQTNNYISMFNAKYIYLVQLLNSKIIAHKVFDKIPQRQDCNNKIIAHKLTYKLRTLI